MPLRKLPYLALAALALTFAGAAHAQAVPEKVRFAWYHSPGPWVIGKAEGLFPKVMGTDVAWVEFAGGGQVLSAFAAGEIDIAVQGSPPTVSGLVRGLPIEIIAIEGVIATSERLVVRPSIHSLKDLEGKRLAYPPSTSSHYGLIATIAANHLDATKITLLGMTAPNMAAAWRRGDIDGGFAWPPAIDEMQNDNGHVIATMRDLQPKGYIVWNSFVARKDFAARYPALVVAFLKTFRDCVAQYASDADKAVAVEAAELGQKVDVVREAMAGRDYIPYEDQITKAWLGDEQNKGESRVAENLIKTAEFLADAGQLRRDDIPKSFAGFINPGFMQRLLKQQ
jgi:taurine transport system substrate-binding protein